ncbi:cobyric acid synthase [Leifsonia xyli subsp. cynodontis DSM 46306]|uniref:Lipid II isoglutaminyl synthase (glutamine-hydrolyzing) subunit GatD n=1 Tax=Leifsonia xyli subsp. cynodontis DSM 46306 TaxID=1389489 RepID=U3P5N3_LEIXC|nr:cobyric acid synthase [Leifsonia xyli]AGW41620.1 cobyric acid synthase [Leifsonia xyli subsp. cynodontis DSM 46306]
MSLLRILHLYPRELGINGDAGNVHALLERARWRGVEAEAVGHSAGGELPASVDLIHIGSGPLSSQRAVHDDVLRIAPRLRQWRDAGVPILAIAGGWQLLGRELVTPDGETLGGAEVFPTRAVLGAKRYVSEAVVRTADGTALAGFENHSAVTTLEGGEPLGRIVGGDGNGDGTEGIVLGAAIGTHLHGPALPMNPALADRMLARALRAELPPVPQTERVDRYAANARRAIADRLGATL